MASTETSTSIDPLAVRYGQKIRLHAVSAYAAPAPSSDESVPHQLTGIGYYEKNGRHGILSCVPPLGDKLDHLFFEDEYEVLDPTGTQDRGAPVLYGQPLVLVNQHGMVWNNKTGGITGYIGPRPRNIPGEMYVAFRFKSKPRALSRSNGSPTSASSHSESLRYDGRRGSTASASGVMQGVQGPVCYGDQDVVVDVVEANRRTQMFNNTLSNFKKPTSRTVGGYICCDGKGTELKFTICPSIPKVEQISMMKKLITSYQYGQKILLPLALLNPEQEKAKRKIANAQPAEIVFKLSNDTRAVLPGVLLQQKIMAHATTEEQEKKSHNTAEKTQGQSTDDKESVFALPIRNGPGELMVKLIGSIPRRAIGRLPGNGSTSTPDKKGTGKEKDSVVKRKVPVFYVLAKLLRSVPMPIFALVYAVLTHFCWSGLHAMGQGAKREAIVLLLVLFPAFYLAVKLDHPFSSVFLPPHLEQEQDDEPQPSGSLKLIVMEYRFIPGAPVLSEDDMTSNEMSTDASPGTVAVPPSDVPRRFILAEKGDEEKGRIRYEETLQWRQEEGLDEILQKPWPLFKLIKDNYPHFYHKRGKNGEPVYYEKPGKIKLKELKAAGVTLDDLMRNFITITEFLWNVIEKDDNKKCISVIDMEGVGIRDFVGEAVEYVRKAAAVSGKHYPERCAYIIVINAPGWSSMIWKSVRGMLDEVTREKVSFVTSKKNFEALSERIPAENIPTEYGGLSEGIGPEEELLRQTMAYLNKDDGAPTTNPMLTPSDAPAPPQVS